MISKLVFAMTSIGDAAAPSLLSSMKLSKDVLPMRGGVTETATRCALR